MLLLLWRRQQVWQLQEENWIEWSIRKLSERNLPRMKLKILGFTFFTLVKNYPLQPLTVPAAFHPPPCFLLCQHDLKRKSAHKGSQDIVKTVSLKVTEWLCNLNDLKQFLSYKLPYYSCCYDLKCDLQHMPPASRDRCIQQHWKESRRCLKRKSLASKGTTPNTFTSSSTNIKMNGYWSYHW